MLDKIRGNIYKTKKYAIVGGVVISACAISFISYRVGCQHGVDVTRRVIHKYDLDLFEQVDKLLHSIN